MITCSVIANSSHFYQINYNLSSALPPSNLTRYPQVAPSLKVPGVSQSHITTSSEIVCMLRDIAETVAISGDIDDYKRVRPICRW
jgi:hypothetical protein